jgi:hypothetical protein
MATTVNHVDGWRGHQWVIPAWVGLAALIVLPLLVVFVLAATDDDENVVLSRNDVVTDASGNRTWHGAMMNRTGSVYREVAVTIRFLDLDGQPAGEASGNADRLEPGEKLNLQAQLPAQAVSMQVYSLQWRTGNVGRLLGPWAPWQFGYLQYDPSD